MLVSNENISELHNLGATCIRKLFNEHEMCGIDQAIIDVIKKPSAMCDVFQSDGEGKPLFFNDFNNWRRIPSLREICMADKMGDIVRRLMKSETAHLFHDHVIVKDEGTTKETPWHIDKTYFMVDGAKTVSLWIPTSDLLKEESLRFIAKSHLQRTLYAPKSFGENKDLEAGQDFKEIPRNLETFAEDVLSWGLERGDAIAFTYYTLHSAPAYTVTQHRRALSIRYFGSGTTFDARILNPAPPFVQMGYKGQHGDPISETWFPRLN